MLIDEANLEPLLELLESISSDSRGNNSDSWMYSCLS